MLPAQAPRRPCCARSSDSLTRSAHAVTPTSQLAALRSASPRASRPPTARASSAYAAVLRERADGRQRGARRGARPRAEDRPARPAAGAGRPAARGAPGEGSRGPQARSRRPAGRQPRADRRGPPRRGLRPRAPRRSSPGRVKAQHDMRIAVKRLRYVLELVRRLLRPYTRTAMRRTKELQDVLGEIHDCDVVLPRVLDAPGRATRGGHGRRPRRGRPAPPTSIRRSRRARRTQRPVAAWSRSAPTCEARRALLFERFLVAVAADGTRRASARSCSPRRERAARRALDAVFTRDGQPDAVEQ